MFKIKINENKPDIKYLKERVEELMEDGIRVTDRIEEILENLKRETNSSKEVIRRYGVNNPNSAPQVIKYLQSLNDEDVEKCCKDSRTGKWSSNADNLKKLAHLDIDFAVDLLTYRRSKKFVESVQSLADFKEEDGNFVHPNATMGKTNRINYTEPAIMNIPKSLLWELIVPSIDGNVLVSVDIKNQEPWILFNMLNIEKLKEALKDNSEGGLYNGLFRIIFGKEPTPIERKEFKTSWNALTYGSTKRNIMSICRNIDGEKVYKYFSKIPELSEYKDKCYKLAYANKRNTKTLFGTELIADAPTKGMLQRQLMDLPIQGTGADILSLLVQHFDSEMDSRGLVDKMWVYFTRHDEVVIEVDGTWFNEQGEEKVYEVLRDIFEHQIEDWEPFKVEIGKVQSEISFDDNEDEE